MLSKNLAISVRNLSKVYQIYDKPSDRLKQILSFGKKKYYREFCALENVSFEIRKGEMVGIIGVNGSGKSTLLQLICGTLNPSCGDIQITGKVAALLELGSGFNLEFTGRENIYLNASLLGLKDHEIEDRFEKISQFADIGKFIEEPIKIYSSGMLMRLAFSVIAHVDADILIIDEALAVGDVFFTQKCMRFLRNFMKQGTVLFVSHDTSLISSLCNKGILLNKGKLIKYDSAKNIIQSYLELNYSLNQDVLGTKKNDSSTTSLIRSKDQGFEEDRSASKLDSFGTGLALVNSVRLLDENGLSKKIMEVGRKVTIEIECISNKVIKKPIIGFHFRNKFGQIIFCENTFLTYNNQTIKVVKNQKIKATFSFIFPILPSGSYTISPAIAEGSQDDHIQHHWVHDALEIKVINPLACHGLVGLEIKKIILEAK